MVICEAEVVPVSLPDDSGGTLDARSLSDDADPLFRDSRPSRAYYDDRGWKSLDDYSSDAPVEEAATGWKQRYKKLDQILVNGAKRRHWTLAKNEITQIMARCQDTLGKESLQRSDFVAYYFGVTSPLFIQFQQRLMWDHRAFLQFVMTCARLSANQWSVSKLYDLDHRQQMMERMMERGDFLSCWKQIEECGISDSLETSANDEAPFWEDCQNSLNKLNRNLVVTGRSGRQTYINDDDKIEVETDPRTHRNLNFKIVKHVADNRFGMICDTIVTTAVGPTRRPSLRVRHIGVWPGGVGEEIPDRR